MSTPISSASHQKSVILVVSTVYMFASLGTVGLSHPDSADKDSLE